MYNPRPTEILTGSHVYFCSGYLSNFFTAPFTHLGIQYTGSEQFYMRQKALYFDNHDIADKILNASEPKEQKKLGRAITGFSRDLWIEPSIKAMRFAVMLKFASNQKLLSQLLAAYVRFVGKGPLAGIYTRKFVEAAPWDVIWGIGLGLDSPFIYNEEDWRGLNLLGDCITTVAEFFYDKLSYDPATKRYDADVLVDLVIKLSSFPLVLK